MSTTVDQRVVEMRFDNKNFESNVSTTMSTLDKLKQKLNFTGASKGLESIGTSAKKVDMSGLSGAVDTVSSRFSALEVIGVTALANITNSAVNAGKRLVASLSVDQISSGWQKFGSKTTSVATLTAQGNALEDVNEQLDRLNWFTDETSYNFTDMVASIAKFTATGKGLEESVTAMEGIATWAALSGQNATTASQAMYQLSQAMGAGVMRKEDYKSIQNASMDTEEFRQKCLDAAVALGTLKKNADDTYTSLVNDKGAFNISQFAEHLTQDAWFTSDVMMEVFNQYSSAVNSIYEVTEEKGMLASEVIDEIHDKATREGISTDEAIKALGYDFDSFALKAFEAAQKARTFNDAIDSVKDAVSTGWMKTFEIIFGNAEEATELWTNLANTLYDVFAAGGETRNAVLEDVMVSKWDQLSSKIEDAGLNVDNYLTAIEEVARENGITVDDLVDSYDSLKKAIKAGKVPANVLTKALNKLLGTENKLGDSTEEITESLEEYEKIADRVIRGEFGSGQARWDKLTEAGYDWAKVQNIVNERLGSSVRHMSELTDEQVKNADSLSELSDEQLKNKGYTEEQIKALRELKKAADEGGTSINEMIEDLERPSGRDLLLESFSNMGKAIAAIVKPFKEAWSNVFGDINVSEVLYNLIEGFRDLTESMIISEDTANNFKKVFEGLFTLQKISAGVLGKTVISGIKLLSAVLELFGTDLVGVAAKLADYIILFGNWVEEHTIFVNMMSKVAKILHAVIDGVHRCVKAFTELKVVSNFIKKIGDIFGDFFGKIGEGFDGLNIDNFVDKINKLFDKIEAWIKGADNAENLGKYLIDGLVKGITYGVKKVVNAIKNIATTIIETFCALLGIESPSKIFIALGIFLIDGLIIGITQAQTGVYTTLINFAKKCIETIKGWFTSIGSGAVNLGSIIIGVIKKAFSKVFAFLTSLDWGTILTTAFGVGMLVLAYKLTNILELLATPIEGLGKILKNVASFISTLGDSLAKYFKAKAFKETSGAILNMAIAVGILAASVYVLAKVDSDNLWNAIGAVAALAGIVAALAGVSALINKFAGGFGGEALSLMAMAGALLLISIAMQKISDIDAENATTVLKLMGGMVGSLAVLMFAFGKFCNVEAFADMAKAGIMFIGMAAAMLIMVQVIKIAGKMDGATVKNGIKVVAVIGVLFTAVIAVSHFAGQYASRAGTMLLKMSIAFLAMLGVIKLASMLDKGEVITGARVIVLVGTMFAALIAVSNLAGKNATKAGGMLLMASAALMLIVLAIKSIARMDPSDIKKGLTVITVIGLIFTALIAVSKMSGQYAAKAGAMLIQMSGAVLILVGAMYLLTKFEDRDLVRSLGAITIMVGLMAGLIVVSKLAGDVKKGPLIALVASIAVLAMAVFALSLIDPDQLKSAVAGLSTLLIAFGLLIASTKFIGDVKIGKIMPLIAVVIVLAGIVAGLSLIDSENALANVSALSLLMLTFAGCMFILGILPNIEQTVSKTLLPMLGVVAGLALIIGGLSLIQDVDGAIKMTGALIVLLLAFTGVTAVLATIGKGDAAGSAAKGGAALAIIVGIVSALTLLIGGLIGLISDDWMATIETGLDRYIAMVTKMGPMILAFIPLTVALAALGKFVGVGAPAKGAAALSEVIGIISAVTVVIGVLMGLFTDDGFSKLETGLDRYIAMITKMGPMILAFIPLTVALAALGKFVGVGAPAKGAVALSEVIGIVGALLAAIGVLMGLFTDDSFAKLETGLDRYIAMIEKMGVLILAFIPLTVALAAIGKFLGAGAAAKGALALSAVIGIIGAVAVAIGVLMGLFTDDSFAKLETGLDRFTSVMIKIGEAIGGFVGGVIGGLAEGALAAVGNGLSAFMNNAKDFIDGCSKINESVLAGAGILAGAIVAISAADIVAGVSKWLSLGTSFAGLGADLSGFMNNAGDFIDGASDLEPSMLEGVKTLSESILILTRASFIDGLARLVGLGTSSLSVFGEQLPVLGSGIAGFASSLDGFEGKNDLVAQAADAIKILAQASSEIPNTGGWLAALIGDNDLSTWADQLPNVGSGISGFISNLGDFDESKVETAKLAAEVIKILAGAAMNIPNTGGLLADLIGDNDLSTWANQLPNVGSGISGFISNLGDFDSGKVETAQAAADVISILAKAASKIPNTGGWLAALIGDNDLSTWANQLPNVATGITGFLENLGDFDESKVETAKLAAEVIKMLADASESIDGQADWAKKIFGDNSLSTFSDQFADLGSNIATFVENLGTFSEDQVKTVQQAVAAIRAFATLADSDLKGAKSNLEGFSDKLPDFGSNIGDFCDNLPSTDTVKSAVDNVKKIIGAIEDICDLDTSAFGDFVDSLGEAGEKGINKFVKSFTSETAQTDVKDAAKKLVGYAVKGIEAKEDDFKDACDDLASKGASGVEKKSNYDDFKDAGKYLAKGLIKGIEAKEDDVYNAAYKLGQKAVQGEKDGQASNSPSKLTIQAGKWLGEGLIKGMSEVTSQVYDSGSALGETATNSISSAISKLSSAMDTDIDYQPTIRPVLDLTDVEYGADTMNEMLADRVIRGEFGSGQARWDKLTEAGYDWAKVQNIVNERLGSSVRHTSESTDEQSTISSSLNQLSTDVLTGLNNISTTMNSRNQNEGNSDVVSAIGKLRDDLSTYGSKIYNINGVTYNDDSNLSDAVETIIRYANIERRV